MLDSCSLVEHVHYLHGRVWDFRRQHSQFFVTPSPLFSLYFAETEIGEARDAWIRANAATAFKRAHDRQRNLQLELGQTLMMLLTAFDEDRPVGPVRMDQVSLSYAAIAIASATAVMEATVDGDTCIADDCAEVWQLFAWEAIVQVMSLLDSPVDTMENVLADIYTKRVLPHLQPNVE